MQSGQESEWGRRAGSGVWCAQWKDVRIQGTQTHGEKTWWMSRADRVDGQIDRWIALSLGKKKKKKAWQVDKGWLLQLDEYSDKWVGGVKGYSSQRKVCFMILTLSLSGMSQHVQLIAALPKYCKFCMTVKSIPGWSGVRDFLCSM